MAECPRCCVRQWSRVSETRAAWVVVEGGGEEVAGADLSAPQMRPGPGSARQNGQGGAARAGVRLKSVGYCGRNHTPYEMHHTLRRVQKMYQRGLRNNHRTLGGSQPRFKAETASYRRVLGSPTNGVFLLPLHQR